MSNKQTHKRVSVYFLALSLCIPSSTDMQPSTSYSAECIETLIPLLFRKRAQVPLNSYAKPEIALLIQCWHLWFGSTVTRSRCSRGPEPIWSVINPLVESYPSKSRTLMSQQFVSVVISPAGECLLVRIPVVNGSYCGSCESRRRTNTPGKEWNLWTTKILMVCWSSQVIALPMFPNHIITMIRMTNTCSHMVNMLAWP